MTGLATETPNAPAIFNFTSVGEWLAAWVTFQMAKSRPSGYTPRTKLPSGDALNLCGSIGYDSAIASDGTVWINDYGHTDQDNWRITTHCERISFLITAQQRSYPELIMLLPVKPTHAIPCSACDGSGLMHHVPAINCMACGSLGWVVANGT